jgi:glutaredoxin-like protein NrdH
MSDKTPTVYTLPNCPACDQTKKRMQRNGVEYKEVNLALDKAAMDYVTKKGYTQAPIVETDKEMWSGFHIDKIDGIGK